MSVKFKLAGSLKSKYEFLLSRIEQEISNSKFHSNEMNFNEFTICLNFEFEIFKIV